MKKTKKSMKMLNAVLVIAFVIFTISVIGINISFYQEYTPGEIQRAKDQGYYHDSIGESIVHNLQNGWLNLQDLMKDNK